jgi:hypothetical protein
MNMKQNDRKKYEHRAVEVGSGRSIGISGEHRKK